MSLECWCLRKKYNICIGVAKEQPTVVSGSLYSSALVSSSKSRSANHPGFLSVVVS